MPHTGSDKITRGAPIATESPRFCAAPPPRLDDANLSRFAGVSKAAKAAEREPTGEILSEAKDLVPFEFLNLHNGAPAPPGCRITPSLLPE